MKNLLGFVVAFAALLTTAGCGKTIETVHAPADAYNIRKPADTPRATSQTTTTIIERK